MCGPYFCGWLVMPLQNRTVLVLLDRVPAPFTDAEEVIPRVYGPRRAARRISNIKPNTDIKFSWHQNTRSALYTLYVIFILMWRKKCISIHNILILQYIVALTRTRPGFYFWPYYWFWLFKWSLYPRPLFNKPVAQNSVHCKMLLGQTLVAVLPCTRVHEYVLAYWWWYSNIWRKQFHSSRNNSGQVSFDSPKHTSELCKKTRELDCAFSQEIL